MAYPHPKSTSKRVPHSSSLLEVEPKSVPHSSSLLEVEPGLVSISSHDVLGRYQDIQLPSFTQVEHKGSSVRHLTHPSELGKRGKGSRTGAGKESVGGDQTSRKRKRKFEDQPDVFDHLATLRRKQSAQMELSFRDSQEVPVSPQFPHSSGDFLSFHSSLSPAKAEQDSPKVKRVLFAPDTLEDSPRMLHAPWLGSVEEGETERGGAEITPEADTSFTVPSLDFTPEHTEHEVEHAEVPSLVSNAVLQPYVTSPVVGSGATGSVPPRPPGGRDEGGCSDTYHEPPDFNILHYFPREE